MADHGLRLRRFSAPSPASRIAAPPSSNHGPIPPVGGCVGGPVAVSADAADGETEGASAFGAGDGVVADAVSAEGVTRAALPEGGVVLCVGAAAVGARGGGHTCVYETADGRVPVPTE